MLLAVALGLAVVGLYNPQPDGKQLLPSYGPPFEHLNADPRTRFNTTVVPDPELQQASTRLITTRETERVALLEAVPASAIHTAPPA